MPWAKPKATGAYLAVYRGMYERLVATPLGEWHPMLKAPTILDCERVVRQGRVWARLALSDTYRMSFRHKDLVVEARLQEATPGLAALTKDIAELARK